MLIFKDDLDKIDNMDKIDGVRRVNMKSEYRYYSDLVLCQLCNVVCHPERSEGSRLVK